MKIVLIGAGGKMGVRLSLNLAKSDYEVAHVEVSDAGRARLREAVGVDCVPLEQALDGAAVVLLAVPDTLIGKVCAGLINDLEPGTIVVILDAAAPAAGHLPERADITYFVTHPCHPPIFNDESERDARKDYFGGIAARQSIVSA